MRPASERLPTEPLASTDAYRRLLLDGVPLIDVRAPVEFARGSLPGAINLPLMVDEERHLVGIRYKQAGQDKAIELGAQLVDEQQRRLRTEAWRAHVQTHPDAVVYCFRGGLRSRIAQAWLYEVGVTRPLIEGGYKAVRQYLIEELERQCARTSFSLVAGRTGSGKTLLLKCLERHVDLEGIACHRGSSFGNLAVEQPSPIDVEHAITLALMRLDASLPERDDADRASLARRRVWLEDEGKLIGKVCLPPALRAAMARAPAVVLETSMAVRIANCLEDYVPDLLARYARGRDADSAFEAYADHHRQSLARIRKRLGGVRHAQATDLLERALRAHREHGDTSGYAALIELLLTHYYDPMYDYQLLQKRRRILFSGSDEDILAWSSLDDTPGDMPDDLLADMPVEGDDNRVEGEAKEAS